MSKFSDLPENTTPANEDIVAIEQDADGLNRKVQLGNLPIVSELASTATGQGASKVGIEDASGNFTSTTVEGALAELHAMLDGLDSWVSGTTYTANEDVVILDSNNKIYRCLTTNSDVVFDPAKWQVVGKDSYTITNDTATGSNQTLTAPTTDLIRLTDAGLVSVDMVPAGETGNPIWLINDTGNPIVINNETGATATDRIKTGQAGPLTLADQASIQLVYDTTDQRWQVVGGTGSGTGDGGSGISDPDTLFVDNSDDNEAVEFVFDGWSISTTNPINGLSTFVGVHDAILNKTMKKTFDVPAKFQGKNLNVVLDANSGASAGNVTLTVRDETNAVDLISEQISLVNDLTKSVKSSFTFDCPANCVSMSYTVTALPEAGAPETRIDDITLKLNKRETTEISQVKQETNVFSARIANNGTASIISQSEPFIASVNRSAQGVIDVVFISGFFTEAPAITATADNGNSYNVMAHTITASGFTIGSRVTTTAGTVDTNISIDVHRQGSDYKDQTVSVEREQSTFNEVLVEEADSMVRLSVVTGHGTTNTKIRRFTNIEENIGEGIIYNTSPADGDSFTVVESGYYSLSYSDNFNGGGWFGFSKNSANLTTNITDLPVSEILNSSTTSGTNESSAVSWSGYLASGDVIRPHTNGNTTGTNSDNTAFTISKVGIPKIASVAPESKVKIPTSELRMEGLSGLGTGSETRTVKYSSISKIRGDGFTVDNSIATIITIKKNGVFSISASVEAGSANRTFHITKNATNPTAAPNQDEILATAVEETGTHSLNLSSGQISVVAGDKIRVYSDGTSTVLNHSLQAFHQEQEIQVAVSNVTPQYEDADSMVRLSGPFSYGSVNTYGIRLSSLEQNIGDDIDYFDNPDNGAEFTIKTSGYYSLSGLIYFNSAAHGFGITVNRNYIGDIAEVDSTDVLQSAYQVSNPSLPSLSWSGYLNEGDVLRIIAHKNTGVDGGSYLPDGDPSRNTWTSFTIAKVGVPSIAEVDVTPFVDLQDQGWKVNSISLSGNGGQTYIATEPTPFNGGGKGWGGDSYTVQNDDSVIQLSFSTRFTTTAQRGYAIYKNGAVFEYVSQSNSDTTHTGGWTSSRGDFSKGDILTLRSFTGGGTFANSNDQHFLNLNEWYRADQYERIYAVEQNENEFSAVIQNNGSASIRSQSGNFIESVEWQGTGWVKVNFVDGFFSEIPSINVTSWSTNGRIATVDDATNPVTVNGFYYFTYAHNNTPEDRDVSIAVSRQGADRKDLQRQLASISDFPRVNNQLSQKIHYHGVTGYGSTSIFVPIFTNKESITGDSILSVNNTTTDGFSVTALRDCVVNASYSYPTTTATNHTTGWSLNSNNTATNISGIPASERVAISTTHDDGFQSGNIWSQSTVSITLKKGDILRPHTNGSSIGPSNATATMVVTAQAQELERVDSVERAENVFSARIDLNGNLLSENTSFIESVSRPTTGNYLITFKSGFFTQEPALVSLTTGSFRHSNVVSFGSNTVTVQIYRSDTSAPDNRDFSIILQRQGDDYKLLSDVVVAIPEAQVAYLKDVKAQGVAGQTIPDDVWTTRDLTELTGDSTFVTLDPVLDRFTVSSGTYLIEWKSPQRGGGAGITRLRNITDGVDDGQGSNTSGDNTQFDTVHSIGEVYITLSEPKTYEIQHYLNAGPVNGGDPLNLAGYSEIYTQVKITKLR